MIIIIISILTTFLLLILATYLTNKNLSASGYKGEISDHFDGDRFWNIGEREGPIHFYDEKTNPRPENLGRFGFIKWMLRRDRNVWKKESIIKSKEKVNVVERSEKLKVTFINHATVLLQLDNLNIITDPVFSYRASPFSFIGPKRYVEPAIAMIDLPHIDLILLSHNHYDHMDIKSLKYISGKFNSQIVTGLGNKEYLEDRGIKNVIEKDWFESRELNLNNKNFKVTFLPSQHFSARGFSDRNKTLWGGFALTGLSSSIYFAGDTGYGPFVNKIKEVYPSGFDLGLIPIGAYSPRYFMRAVHTDPYEALSIARELNVKESVAIHYGTFALAGDGQYEPITDLENVKKLEEFKSINFIVKN
jgi:L-ascorbate metabolism protein UlaG (beta-lactamase superfamily)